MVKFLHAIITFLYHLPCSFLRDKLFFGDIQRAFAKRNIHLATAQNNLVLPYITSCNLKTVAVQHNPKSGFHRTVLRFTLLLILLLALVGAAWGQETETLLPDGDMNAGGWTATPLWSKIDGADGNYIQSGNNNTTAVFSIQNPSSAGIYSKVSIKFRAQQNAQQAGSPELYSDITISGIAIGEKLVSSNLGHTSFTDYSVEWDNLNYSQTQMNSLQVVIRSANTNPNRIPYVDFIEVTLTYEEEQACDDATLTLTSSSASQSVCAGTAISDIVYTYGGGATGVNVTNLPAGLTSSVNAGAQSVTISGTPTANGTYTVSTTGANQCEEVSLSGTITVNPLPERPNIVAVTQPDCETATGSVELNGLPSGSWLLTQQPGSTTIPGSGTNTTISGLSPETYSYTVINLCPGSGSGLTAEYFNNMTLSGTPALTQTDATVNFDWGNGGPGSPIGNDNFSVRWSGKILPCFSEIYTFFTRSDDGVRLWVDGTQIIDNWTDHASTINEGTISLVAGQLYDIVLEFYENGGQAVAKLYWESNSQSYGIIPQTQLFPAGTSAVVCSSPPTEDVVINGQPATTQISTHPSTSGQNLCLGEDAATLSVTAIGDGLTYQWNSNITNSNSGGTLIDGATNTNYTPSTSAAGTLYYYCVVTGDCGTETSDVSGAITVNENLTVSVSIDASPSGPVCAGTEVTFTATPTNGGTNPVYQWQVNGIDAGTNSTSFSYTPDDGDVITCILISDATCTAGGATIPVTTFSWNDNTKDVTDSDYGLNAIAIGGGVYMPGGVGGTLALGPVTNPKTDIDLNFGDQPEFNTDGVNYSISYQRAENLGQLFHRGNSLIISGGNTFNVTYRLDDGAGSFTTVTSSNFTINQDGSFHDYRFVYNPSDGIGRLYIDNSEVWTSSPTPGQSMYWTGSGDLIVGRQIDASGNAIPTFDNLFIKGISLNTAVDEKTVTVHPLPATGEIIPD